MKLGIGNSHGERDGLTGTGLGSGVYEANRREGSQDKF